MSKQHSGPPRPPDPEGCGEGGRCTGTIGGPWCASTADALGAAEWRSVPLETGGMMGEIEVPALLSAFGYPSSSATAVIIEQTPAQRLGRVLTGLGMFWGLALVGLFIPVAHFFLVPTFGIAGIITAVKRAREDRRLIRLRGACPRCGAAQEFKPGGRFCGERSVNCPKCHGTLTLCAAVSHPGRLRSPHADRVVNELCSDEERR